MTTVLLGLGAALLIGFADYFGSMAGRKGRILAVTFWVFLTGIVVIISGAVIVGGSPSTRDLVLGGVAGIGGGVGLLILYAGYAKTTIGIVGPVAAVIGAVLPVVVGTLTNRPSGTVIAGILVGLVAIGLIGIDRSTELEGGSSARLAALYGFGAGMVFGIMATVIGATDSSAGMWPIVPMRITSVLILAIIGVITRQPLLPERASWRYIPAAAALSAIGIGLFAMSAQRNLTIGGLLLQMAYGVTAVLAILFLGERATGLQKLGFVAAVISLILVTLG